MQLEHLTHQNVALAEGGKGREGEVREGGERGEGGRGEGGEGRGEGGERVRCLAVVY